MAGNTIAVQKPEGKEGFLSDHEVALLAELFEESDGDYEAVARRFDA
jgi:hypothetical protein